MATTVTLHPNGTISNSGFVVTGASLHAALADPSGSNYITGSGSVGDSWRTNMESYTLAADERCRRVRSILNLAKSAGAVSIYIDHNGSSDKLAQSSSSVGVITLTSAWYGTDAELPGHDMDGAGLLQADLDAIEMACATSYGGGADYNQQYEARIQLEILKAPLVDLPSTTYQYHRDVLTLMPWTYTGNGEAQKKYHCKVFTEAETLLGGFDPDVNVPIIDSGIVTSSQAYHTVNGLSYSTAYVTFVKVAKDFNGGDWWTEWVESIVWETIALPVATSITPNSMTLTTNKPLVTWVMTPTAADEEPDPIQRAFYVRIFKLPGGGWGSLGDVDDVDNVNLIEDSGYVESALGSFQTSIPLENETEYRVYVKLIRTSGGFTADVWGDWAYQTFATDFISPATPILVTSPNVNGVDVNLLVTPGLKNLLNANQSSVESNIFGYTFTGGGVGFWETTIAAHGTHSLRFEKTTGAGTLEAEASAEVPCTAGLPYTAQAYVRKASGQAARSVRVGLRWYAAGDTLLSTSWGTGSNDDDTFTIRSVTATAPGTAVEVSIVMEVTSQGLAPEYHYFDKMMIQQTNVVNPWFSGGTPDEQYYVMQKRIDGGEWQYFSTGDGQSSSQYVHTVEPFTVYDREVRFGALMEYRAAAVGTALGIQTQSDWSAIESETILGSVIWLKNLNDPTMNRHFYVEDDWAVKTKRKARAILEPIGRSTPIVIKGVAKASTWPLTFLIVGQTSMDDLLALVDSNIGLFLQTPKGNFYVEVAGDITINEHLWDAVTEEEDVWRVTVPFVEVT